MSSNSFAETKHFLALAQTSASQGALQEAMLFITWGGNRKGGMINKAVLFVTGGEGRGSNAFCSGVEESGACIGLGRTAFVTGSGKGRVGFQKAMLLRRASREGCLLVFGMEGREGRALQKAP
jgi:hypothetical protein